MHTVAPEAITSQLNWRYATKKFDATKKIPAATWQQIENSLVLAPSSYGLQPWKFVTVADAALREKLKPVGYNQPQITDASHLVVLARKTEVTPADVNAYIARISEVRKVPVEALKGYADMMIGSVTNPSHLPGGSMDTYTRSQVYIALGFGLYTAALLGVDACPMEGFDPVKFDELLGLKSLGYKASVMATFGYRAVDDATASMAKVRVKHEDAFIRR
jgi:nitroreductase